MKCNTKKWVILLRNVLCNVVFLRQYIKGVNLIYCYNVKFENRLLISSSNSKVLWIQRISKVYWILKFMLTWIFKAGKFISYVNTYIFLRRVMLLPRSSITLIELIEISWSMLELVSNASSCRKHDVGLMASWLDVLYHIVCMMFYEYFILERVRPRKVYNSLALA